MEKKNVTNLEKIIAKERSFEIDEVWTVSVPEEIFFVKYKDEKTGIENVCIVRNFIADGKITETGRRSFIDTVTGDYEDGNDCETICIDISKDVDDAVESLCKKHGLSSYALWHAISKFCCAPGNRDWCCDYLHRKVNECGGVAIPVDL